MTLKTGCVAHQGEQSEGLYKKRRQDPPGWGINNVPGRGKGWISFSRLAMPGPVWGREVQDTNWEIITAWNSASVCTFLGMRVALSNEPQGVQCRCTRGYQKEASFLNARDFVIDFCLSQRK